MMLEINLLPWRDEIRKQHHKKIVILYGIFLSIIIALCMSCYYYLTQLLAKQERMYAAIARELPQKKSINSFSPAKHQYFLAEILNQLGTLPEDIAISTFINRHNKIKIIGFSSSLSAIKIYMSHVLLNHSVGSVKVVALEEKNDAIRFELLITGRE